MWVAMTPEATPPATRRTTPGGTAVPPMKSLAHLPSKAVAGTLDGPYWSTPVNRDGGPSANLGPQLPQQAATPLQDVREVQPEVPRNVPITLPVLKDVTEPQPALRAGDWLTELMPLISDVSEGASTWCTESLQQAQEAYSRWLAASPLDKMSVQPHTMVESRYKRLEARVLTMLLAAVPAMVKQEAISTRELTCVQLIYKVLKQYQPGE